MQLGTAYYGAIRERWRPGAQPVPGFRLLGRLAHGGQGEEVWSAEGPGGFLVALEIRPLTDATRDAASRALQVLRAVRHPNLLTCFGAWIAEDSLVIGRELADRTLWDRFDEETEAGRAGLDRVELLDALADAAQAIDFLNEPRHAIDGNEGRRAPHGRLRPQSLVLVGGGVKVADFGLAELADPIAEGRRALAYAAPECIRKESAPQSDQYALALIYCQLRGGRLPFRGDAEALRVGHILDAPDLSMLPEPERPALARALAKAPEQRWPSCRTLVEVLRRTEEAAPPGSGPSAAIDVPLRDPLRSGPTRPRLARVHRRPKALAVAAALLVTAGLAFRTAGLIGPARGRSSAGTPAGPAPDPASATIRRVSLRPALPPPDTSSRRLEPADPPAPARRSPSTSILTPPVAYPALPPEPRVVAPVSPNESELADILDHDEPESSAVASLTLEAVGPLAIERGGHATLPIRLKRVGIDGPVTVRFEGLPAGVSAPALTVRADRDAAEAEFRADRRGGAIEADIALIAEAGAARYASSVRLAVRPSRAVARRRSGDEHMVRGEFRLAADAFAEALRADPDDARTWVLRGSAHYRAGDFDAAVAALTRAIRLDPDDAAALNNRGLALRAKGEVYKAIADYNEALRLRPNDPIVRYNRGLAYAHVGDTTMALADLDEAIRLDPTYARAYRARADARDRRGDHRTADRDRDQARRLESAEDGPAVTRGPNPSVAH